MTPSAHVLAFPHEGDAAKRTAECVNMFIAGAWGPVCQTPLTVVTGTCSLCVRLLWPLSLASAEAGGTGGILVASTLAWCNHLCLGTS